MNSCKEVRKLIDQAEKPDLLAFEVIEHIERCSDCERFSSERAGLRKLLASPARVSAPVNFDAALNARLAEVKARRSLWWLRAPGYLRLGAAAAGLALVVFAAQYAGLFSPEAKRALAPQNAVSKAPDERTLTPRAATPPTPVLDPVKEHESSAGASRTRRRDLTVGERISPPGFTSEDGGVVIVRGQNGEMDIQMPTVSVGAQPLLLVGAGRRVTPSGGTSF